MSRFAILSAALTPVVFAAIAQAAPIVNHSGSADPTTEGWTFETLGTGTINKGPITNDAGSGYDAWYVHDASADYGIYYQLFTAGQKADLVANDWTAQMRMRNPNNSDAAGGGVAFDVNLGSGGKRFYVYFGTQADGNPTWDLAGNYAADNTDIPLLARVGLGGGYHLYEFRYNATTTTADFYVDGTIAVAGLAGVSGAGGGNGRVQFASGAGGDQGQGNYNLVTLSLGVVPEPASASLLAIGGLSLLGRRRRV